MLHRKICMWLRSKGTPFSPDQFRTGHVSAGPEEILTWDAALGARPTAQDLAPFDPEVDALASMVRLQRNLLLQESDWTMLPDAPIPSGKVGAWIAYRQALRDLPKQVHFPRAVTWPEKPI